MELLNFGPKKLGFGCMRLPMSEGTVGGEGRCGHPAGLRYGRCLSGAGLLLF